MKKLISLLFAVASTTFLFVGATQAAEKFDTLRNSSTQSVSGPMNDGPGGPCIIVD